MRAQKQHEQTYHHFSWLLEALFNVCACRSHKTWVQECSILTLDAYMRLASICVLWRHFNNRKARRNDLMHLQSTEA